MLALGSSAARVWPQVFLPGTGLAGALQLAVGGMDAVRKARRAAANASGWAVLT